MPHQNVRSACAIAQWAQGKNNFISPQYSDSASDGAPSSEELSPSSDEDDTAAHRLYNIHKGISKKQKIKNLKAPYTGDSQATKFCRQKHWKEAAKGCKKLDGYFPSFTANSIRLRCCGVSWSTVSLYLLTDNATLIIMTGYHNFSDGTFMTAKWLIPECLNMCDTLTIRRFFRKSWQYMDSYRWAFPCTLY